MESELVATTREDDGAEDAMAELLCPICLELLHRPHRLNPCRHLFCDPCLRRLNSQNHDQCPVCRSLIEDCHLDQELHDHIEDQYQDVYIQRQQAEMNTGIFNEPLPLAEDEGNEDSEEFDFIRFLVPIFVLLTLYFCAKCYVLIVEFLLLGIVNIIFD